MEPSAVLYPRQGLPASAPAIILCLHPMEPSWPHTLSLAPHSQRRSAVYSLVSLGSGLFICIEYKLLTIIVSSFMNWNWEEKNRILICFIQ